MPPLLRMQHITKRYPGAIALDDVSFALEAGDVHCLVGENGAGKSTLVKVLSGALQASEGTIEIDGRLADISSPLSAQRLGIGIIYQDFKLVPELSVAENILLGVEPMKQGSPFIDKRTMHRVACEALHRLGEEMDTTVQVGRLGVAQRQLVEIAKALSRKVRILALDEPTASLTGHEIDNLFRVIRQLKTNGVGIIYISHRLEEIFDIGDTVTVLRDGRFVQSSSLSNVDRRTLIRWMVGRELENEFPRVTLKRGEVLLRVEHLHTDLLHDINLTLHRGEILGLAGLVGAGRTEFARALFGADKVKRGKIILEDKEIAPHSPHDAINEGIALLTEDRNQLGLILQMSVRKNISLSSLDGLRVGPFIHQQKELSATRKYVDELHIKPPTVDVEVDTLSGGNRQKVVLARWLNTNARLLIFDEPTAGIDVGAKYEIYTMINTLAGRGIGVIMISSDLPELLGICSRIAVMCEGRITGFLEGTDLTQEHIMTLATSRTVA